jgi:iron complex outermembrane recepter protein
LAAGSFPGGDPNNVTLFVDGRNRNLGTSNTRGVDVVAKQRWRTDSVGDFSLSVSGTYFTKYETALTPNGTVTDRLNTLYNPLRLKARAAATWDYVPFSTQLTLNYVNSYDNNAVTPTQRVTDYTPVDLSFAVLGDDIDWLGSFGSGFAVVLEVRNVFDEDPPYVNIAQSGNGGGGFDPTAANPVGRLIGLRIRKGWR